MNNNTPHYLRRTGTSERITTRDSGEATIYDDLETAEEHSRHLCGRLPFDVEPISVAEWASRYIKPVVDAKRTASSGGDINRALAILGYLLDNGNVPHHLQNETVKLLAVLAS